MKLNYEVEKLADWHYDKFRHPENELTYIEAIWLTDNILSKRDNVLEAPDKFGGINRIHIGDTALQVNNKNINSRSEKMRLVGYTEHDYFIEFNNDIFDDLANFLKDRYKLSYEHHCTIIVNPGQCMPAHGDTYSYLMKLMAKDYPEVEYDLKENTRRYMMFLTDWEWGQSFGAGNIIKGQWRIGDVYSWKHKLLHWCSNASFTPIVFFEITGLEL